jgi:hypothetical protein
MIKIMQRLKGRLSFPFSYYWKSYSKSECPFCKSKSLACSKNGDLFWCRGYATYVSDGACEGYACSCKGHCDNCCDNCGPTVDYILREEVEDEVFFCEDCHHGVNFTEMKLITGFFEQREKALCKYCQWHLDMVKKHRK